MMKKHIFKKRITENEMSKNWVEKILNGES